MTEIADLVRAVSWPAFAFTALVVFRREIKGTFGRIEVLKAFGVEAKIAKEMEAAAQEALTTEGKTSGPTTADLIRSEKVDDLASELSLRAIREQAEQLAADYERIRGTQPPSEERTRRMEAVVGKMRALGRAVIPLRLELAASSSPGKRLQTIASLQVLPDYDLLGWLADRTRTETPFVAWHAIVAIDQAARALDAKSMRTRSPEASRPPNGTLRWTGRPIVKPSLRRSRVASLTCRRYHVGTARTVSLIAV